MTVFQEEASNLRVYNSDEVVSHYAELDNLAPCERFLIDTYLEPGMDVVDLGVGGGRTTPHLSRLARHYVGIDYASAMVNVCREKFPRLSFLQADAYAMEMLTDNSFDLAFFSFNGLDMLTDKKRRACLSECNRVLRPGGIFIFSSHNPRAILAPCRWNRNRVKAFSRKVVRNRRSLYPLTLIAVTSASATVTLLRSAMLTLDKCVRRIPQKAFRRGDGYMFDPAHGGLTTHYSVPEKVVSELRDFHFVCLQLIPNDYPCKTSRYTTDWYYYAFSKSRDFGDKRACA